MNESPCDLFNSNFTYDLLKNIFLTKQTSSTTYVNSNIEAHKINEL